MTNFKDDLEVKNMMVGFSNGTVEEELSHRNEPYFVIGQLQVRGQRATRRVSNLLERVRELEKQLEVFHQM